VDAPGNYLQPTLIETDDPGAEVAQQEVFAPVCALLAAPDSTAAAEIARGVRYGLSTAVYTRDLDRALALARDLDTGLVRSTSPPPASTSTCPSAARRPPASGRASRAGPRVVLHLDPHDPDLAVLLRRSAAGRVGAPSSC
jgi:aldehyde dehydrogenase (NAD+)